MPFSLQTKLPFVSTENTSENNSCLIFFYFFLGCYIVCVSFLIYTLIRLLKYYLKQRRLHAITNEILNQPSTVATTMLLQIHNLNEQDIISMKDSELDLFQPLIIQTHDLPPVYTANHHQPPPPGYKEH